MSRNEIIYELIYGASSLCMAGGRPGMPAAMGAHHGESLFVVVYVFIDNIDHTGTVLPSMRPRRTWRNLLTTMYDLFFIFIRKLVFI